APGPGRRPAALALLRRRARGPPPARVRAHRRCERPDVHRRVELVLGGAVEAIRRPLAGIHRGEALVKRVWQWLAIALVALAAMTVGAAYGVWMLLRAAPGEWSTPLQWGRWRIEASVPTLIRMATHPVLLQ